MNDFQGLHCQDAKVEESEERLAKAAAGRAKRAEPYLPANLGVQGSDYGAAQTHHRDWLDVCC
jgi:hypothetical protein